MRIFRKKSFCKKQLTIEIFQKKKNKKKNFRYQKSFLKNNWLPKKYSEIDTEKLWNYENYPRKTSDYRAFSRRTPFQEFSEKTSAANYPKKGFWVKEKFLGKTIDYRKTFRKKPWNYDNFPEKTIDYRECWEKSDFRNVQKNAGDYKNLARCLTSMPGIYTLTGLLWKREHTASKIRPPRTGMEKSTSTLDENRLAITWSRPKSTSYYRFLSTSHWVENFNIIWNCWCSNSLKIEFFPFLPKSGQKRSLISVEVDFLWRLVYRRRLSWKN